MDTIGIALMSHFVMEFFHKHCLTLAYLFAFILQFEIDNFLN